MTGMSHDEIIELTGAYALDALDEDEAAIVAAHIAQCPQCAAEVRDHQEIAGFLANSGGDAPGHLWDQIAVRIERPAEAEHPPGDEQVVTILHSHRTGSERTRPESPRPAGRPPAARAWLTGAVAAALVVIAVLGIQVGRLDHHVHQLQAVGADQSLAQSAQSAFADPQARRVTLTAELGTGPAMAKIAILPSGLAYVMNKALPTLERDQTYQLWGKVGGQVVSLGLLGSHPTTVPFRVDPSAAIAAFAVTAEHAGGVVRSMHVPVAVSETVSD
jgi:anti-sigma factor RsiW